jgi:S-formylglutathione hydrolase FrmB
MLTAACGVFAQGTLLDDTLYSAALNLRKPVDVYLPHGYNGSTERYPVIYFLHGMGSNQDGYGEMIGLLDNLIAAEILRPMIVVKPDGSCPPFDGSMYTNSALYGRYEDYVTQDLVEYIDGHYRTIADRGSRTIMGHSMGGYGSMKLSLKHPDLYRGVAALAGWMSMEPWNFWHQQLLLENGGHGPYWPENGFFTLATYSAAGAFSPNLNNPPFQVNFPLDSAGNILDSVQALWRQQMPDWIAAHSTISDSLAIYFDCGEQDELGFYPQTVTFDSTLTALGIAHRFMSVPGGHEENLFARGILALVFLDSLMHIPVSDADVPAATAQSFRLAQNYPNPFNSRTQIEFELPAAQAVRLTMFDNLGREVKTLFSGSIGAGRQQISVDAAGLPSGIYFYQLRTASGLTQTRKMLLLR